MSNLKYNLKQTYDKLNSGQNDPYRDMGKKIIESIDTYGLGVMPKSDLEGLIFHCICNALEDQYSDNIKEFDYTLMQMLRISPTKLRSLRVTRSAKFLNDLDYLSPQNRNYIINALRLAPIENEDIINGKIKIHVSDPHVQNLLERMVEENQGVIDFSINPRLVVLNAEQFLKIVSMIYGEGGQDGYNMLINEIVADVKKRHMKITKDNLIEDFKNAFKDKAFSELFSITMNIASSVVKKKIGLS